MHKIALKVLKSQRYDFSFLHFSVPHKPYIFDTEKIDLLELDLRAGGVGEKNQEYVPKSSEGFALKITRKIRQILLKMHVVELSNPIEIVLRMKVDFLLRRFEINPKDTGWRIGILIENHAGAMPTWLSPTQAVVMNISENSAQYAQNVAQMLKKQGFRAFADLRNEKITYKIRDHALQKHPYLIVVGDKERDGNLVAVRARGGVDLGVMSIEDFSSMLQKDISQKDV
jgi:hypothetical protein